MEETRHATKRKERDGGMSATARTVIFVANEGFHGIVTHYYHFLFGAFLPFLEYHIEHNCDFYHIGVDVGPMKSLLCELPLNLLEISGPKSPRRNGEHVVVLPAYDNFSSQMFNCEGVSHIKKTTLAKINKYLDTNIPPYIRLTSLFEILLIERTDKENYYKAFKPGEISGAGLRHIRNHASLATALGTRYGSRFANLNLERCSFFYQYHLFKNVRLVIAQHGAALSNLVFVDPGAAVVEILPPADHLKDEDLRAIARAHFRNLSQFMGLQYKCVAQASDDSDVDVDEVVEAVAQQLEILERTQPPRVDR